MKRREFIALLGGAARIGSCLLHHNVCFWHKADVATVPNDVRFRG
jgi:hypothetical protein